MSGRASLPAYRHAVAECVRVRESSLLVYGQGEEQQPVGRCGRTRGDEVAEKAEDCANRGACGVKEGCDFRCVVPSREHGRGIAWFGGRLGGGGVAMRF